MSFKVMMWFGVGLGVYLIGLGVFTLIKRIINSRKVKKEDNEYNEVNQNEENIK